MILLGANDAILRVSVEKYIANMNLLRLQLEARFVRKVWFAGPTRIWNDDPRINLRVFLYQLELAAWAGDRHINLWTVLEREDTLDGAHPTREGHEKIADAVWAALKK